MFCCNVMQVAVAIKKILYAADAKESALEEAQEYLSQALDSGEAEADEEEENGA